MRNKRALVWLALLALLSLVAAACGDSDDDGGTDAGATTTAAEDGGATTTAGDDGGATTTAAEDGGATTTAAAGGEAAGGEGSIWVLLPDTATSDRWEKDDRRFFGEAFTEAGLTEGEDFTIVNAEGDPVVQQSQAEQAIADGASVIVLTSNDSGSGAAIIDLARAEGVKVVEYDRLNTEGQGGDVYVSFDNVQVGRTMAEVLEPAIDALGVDTPRIVMLNGGPEDNNSQLFRQGYAETAEARADAGDWEIVADEFVPGWDNQEAQRIMEQILVDIDNDVNGVFAANDGLANSVINALEAAGLDATTIPVSGQDATQAGIQNVLLGKQTMSVYKPIQAEASVAAAVALALRAGEDFTDVEGDFSLLVINNESGNPVDEEPGGNNIPYIALTPIGVSVDNIADTVIADGFRTWEELCTGDVEQFCPADR
jgi:D-xylose transport system substrate-binding protein